MPAIVQASRQDRILLLMTGWTDYAWSSDNVAAAQGAQKHDAARSSGKGDRRDNGAR